MKKNYSLAEMRSTEMQNVYTCDAGVRNSEMRDVDMHSSNMQSTEMQNVDTCDAGVRNSEMRDVDMHSSNMQSTEMQSADTRDAGVRNSEMREVGMRSLNMRSSEMLCAEMRRLFSYLCVGGVSAIVEWVLFALFANLLGVNYIPATCIAFVFSTLANLLLGKLWTFKGNTAYEKRLFKEALLIFLVSGAGLLLNIALMWIFVAVVGMSTPALRIFSKILATGIVFIWNYLIRRYVIYRT